MFVKPEGLLVYIKLSSMKPQNNDFNSYIYILYYQSNIHYYYTPIWLVFIMFKIKCCLTEVLEQPGGGSRAFNVMVIRNQRHANVSKQRTLLADVDVATSHDAA